MIRVLAVALALALAARADDSLEARVRALVARLGNDVLDERIAAERELLALGADARALMERERRAATDPEILMRLDDVLRELGRPRWAPSMKAAIEEAQKTGRPILVISADGPVARATSEAGAALRRRLLGDPEVTDALNRRFVLVWWNAADGLPGEPAPDGSEASAVEGDTGPRASLGFYFCTPRGKVRHFLPGWWSPRSLLEEMERIAPILAASDASEALKVRARARESLDARAAELAAAKPADPETRRVRGLADAWARSEEVVGEPVETYLLSRLKDDRAREGPVRTVR